MHKQVLLYGSVTLDLTVALGLRTVLALPSVSRGTAASGTSGEIRLQPCAVGVLRSLQIAVAQWSV